MADRQTHELPIGELPPMVSVTPETLIPAEQSGVARHLTGQQFADFAREAASADAQRAVVAADAAEQAKTSAQRSAALAGDSETAAESSAASAAQDAQNAAARAAAAAASKTGADDAAELAGRYAAMAQAEADRATVPTVEGLYNFILTDRVNQSRYALIVENGRLALLGVSSTLDATNMRLVDMVSGTAYAIYADSGKITLEEV